MSHCGNAVKKLYDVPHELKKIYMFSLYDNLSVIPIHNDLPVCEEETKSLTFFMNKFVINPVLKNPFWHKLLINLFIKTFIYKTMVIQSRVTYIWKLICGLFDWFIYSFGILLFIKRSIHKLCPMGPQTLAFRPPPPPSSFNKSSTRYCIMHVHAGITLQIYELRNCSS